MHSNNNFHLPVCRLKPISLRVVLVIFDLVSYFLKKYHATATRFNICI